MKQKTKLTQAAMWMSLLIVGVSFAFSVRPGHILNGDYALYICQARTLLCGDQWQAYRDMANMLQLSTYPYYSPILYPWGLPLLLVLPYLLCGINYIVFKILLICCAAIALFIMFRDFESRGKTFIGAWVLLLAGLNTILTLSAERVISTLPYMLFLILSITLTHRLQRVSFLHTGQQKKLAVGLGIALFLAIQTRTEGILLLPALLAHQLINGREKTSPCTPKERWPATLLPYGVCLFLFLMTLPWLPVGYLIHAGHTQTPEFSLTENLLYYLTTIPKTCLTFLSPGNTWTNALFWICTAAGMWNAGRKAIAEAAYTTLHLLLLLTWPYQTERYIVPLIPLLLYFMVAGLYGMFRSYLQKWSFIAGSLLLFCTSCQLLNWSIQMYSVSKEYDQLNIDVTGINAQEVFDYLNRHTRPEDLIACSESRTIYLYTGRLSCNLSYSIDDTVTKADWYVLFKNRSNYLQHSPDELSGKPDIFRPVLENEDFIIYKIEQPWTNHTNNRK